MTVVALEKSVINELIELARQGDEDAKTALYNQYKNFLYQMAYKYKAVEYADDMVQVGCVGLLKAIKKFDTGRGLSFITYLEPVVRGEMLKAMRDGLRDFGSIKYNRETMKESNDLKRYAEKHGLGYIEAMRELNIPHERREAIMHRLTVPTSLHSAVVESDTIDLLMIDIIGNEDQDIWGTVLMNEISELLTDKEKIIFKARIIDDISQGEVSKLVGVSQVQVSRLEKKMKAKIKSYLEGDRDGEIEGTNQ